MNWSELINFTKIRLILEAIFRDDPTGGLSFADDEPFGEIFMWFMTSQIDLEGTDSSLETAEDGNSCITKCFKFPTWVK